MSFQQGFGENENGLKAKETVFTDKNNSRLDIDVWLAYSQQEKAEETSAKWEQQ